VTDDVTIGEHEHFADVQADAVSVDETEAVREAHAVVDALSHLGVRHIDLPCTPERVWKALNTGGAGGATEGAAMPHFEPDTEPGQSSTEGAGA
jgi:carbon-monoxide dehydrogenase large subunit